MYIFGKIETMLTIYFNTTTSIHDIRIKYLFASKIDIKYAAGLMKCQYLKLSESITKRTQWSVRPVKTRISLGILPVWSQASLFAWRNLGFLADAQPDWSVRWEHRSFVVGFVMPRLSCLSANQVWTGPLPKAQTSLQFGRGFGLVMVNLTIPNSCHTFIGHRIFLTLFTVHIQRPVWAYNFGVVIYPHSISKQFDGA